MPSQSSTFNSSSPYQTTISEILQLLEKAHIINPDNKQQAINIAQEYLDNNSDFISIEWSTDGVAKQAVDLLKRKSRENSFDEYEMSEMPI